MDIYRNQHHPLTALGQTPGKPLRRTPEAEESTAAPRKRPMDRRIQPDRRRRQMAFEGPERRKRRFRRSPLLLNPRTGQAASLEDRRGRLVSTSA
jgi:hypothetical protein